jgi:hypothetical protein
MSISAVNGVSPVSQPAGSRGVTSIPPATPFSQELDARTGSVHGQHHHGGGSHSVTSSLASVASAAGVTSPETIATSLQHLLT